MRQWEYAIFELFIYFYVFKLGHSVVQAARNIVQPFGERSSNKRTIGGIETNAVGFLYFL